MILDALLIQRGVACQICLLGVDRILDLLLGELGRLVVILEQQIAIGIADVLRQRVLGVLNLLVVGRAAERTALRELRGKLRCHAGVVGVSEVCVGLIDHRLQLWVLTHVRVGTHLRLGTHPRVG